MAEGWIKLHRRFLSSSIWCNPKLTRFWIWCLLKASHSSVKARRGYTEVELSPGQFIFGRLKAADETGLTPDEVRTCVKTLKMENAITVTNHSTRQFSVVTILKWESYQIEENKNPQPFAEEAPTCPQPVPTYKNDKETNSLSACVRMRVGDGDEYWVEDGADLPAPVIGTGGLPEVPVWLVEAGRTISLMPESAMQALLLGGFSPEWLKKAIEEAVLSGKRDWHYVRGILRRWKKEGGPPNENNGTSHTPGRRARPAETSKKPSKFDGLDPWAGAGGNGAAAPGA